MTLKPKKQPGNVNIDALLLKFPHPAKAPNERATGVPVLPGLAEATGSGQPVRSRAFEGQVVEEARCWSTQG